MRKIILDTETTGLDPRQGHRIIEIAAVEMVNRRLTKNHFHQYVNPQREIDAGAQQVHGISLEFLQDKPLFRDIAKDFLEFVSGAELVIHNAPFDIGFINSELKLLGMEMIETCCPVVIDTLKMAKDLHPGQKNNLDALCRRYQVDNTNRTLHGALVDTELLAEVYLGMTRGQESLIIEETIESGIGDGDAVSYVPDDLVVQAAAPDELEAHQTCLGGIDKASKGACLWLALERAASAGAVDSVIER
ncbi:MAG: DNA polymerase III subunit epsilon [Betaproteobacteria bacterium]|nr:DNA polymerase III subunit epsilon [Betaproteobacteria bacterium]